MGVNTHKAAIEAKIEDLIATGGRGWHAHFLARESGASAEEVESVLARYIADGRLQRRFEILCNESGRTMQVHESSEELPLGCEIDCDFCEHPHYIVKSDVWVTYVLPQSKRV
jgi:hypothetical protein